MAALLQVMTLAMLKVPPGTPLAKAISEAHYKISKEVEPGGTSPAGAQNAMRSMALQQTRMQPHMSAQTTHAGMPGGAGAAPGGAPPPSPPMPAG